MRRIARVRCRAFEHQDEPHRNRLRLAQKVGQASRTRGDEIFPRDLLIAIRYLARMVVGERPRPAVARAVLGYFVSGRREEFRPNLAARCAVVIQRPRAG